MKNNYIKYTVLTFFLLMWSNLFSLNNVVKNNNIFNLNSIHKYNSILNLNELLTLSFNKSQIYYFNEGSIFSLTSELVGNICIPNNSNTSDVIVKFALTNVSGSDLSIVGGGAIASAGTKIEFQSTNFNLASFSKKSESTTNLTLDQYALNNYYITAGTFRANESLVFELRFSNSSASSLTGVLDVLYGSSASGSSITNTGSTLIESVSETRGVIRTPLVQPNISRQVHPTAYNTIAYASQLANPSLYRFYLNNELISGSTPLKVEGGVVKISKLVNGVITFDTLPLNSLTYSKVEEGFCEGPNTATINFTPYTTTLPSAGSILISKVNACKGETVEVTNEDLSSSTTNLGARRINPDNYTWELSYDNENTWIDINKAINDYGENISEVKGIVVTGASNNKLVLNGVKRSVKIRRKYQDSSAFLDFGYSNIVTLNVINNEIKFPNDVEVYYIPSGQSFIVPELDSTTYTSTVDIKDDNGHEVNIGQILNLPLGLHKFTYTVTTTAASNSAGLICSSSKILYVNIIDAASCKVNKKRTYANVVRTWSSGLSGVANGSYAINNDRSQHATLTGGVVLLGIGTVGIDLYFAKPDGTLYTGNELLGKKVVIKVGEQYSGLKLAGGMSVVGRLSKASVTQASALRLANANNVGATFGIKGGVLDALKGDNVFEYSFTPKSSTSSNATNEAFNGIRIQLGSVLGVADLASVFYAYIEEDCYLDCSGVTDCVPCYTNNTLTTTQRQNVVTNPSKYEYTYLDVKYHPVKCDDTVVNCLTDEFLEESDKRTLFLADNNILSHCLQEAINVSPASSLLYPITQNDSDGNNMTGIKNSNIRLNPFIEDIYWGNYSEVLNVASGLSSIVFPYYSVDDNYDSYTLFNSTAGVLNKQFLQAKLRQPARPGDQVQITLAYPNINVLNLSLLQLGNFKIVYYFEGTKIAEEKLEKFRVLDIGLFNFKNKRRVVISRPVNFVFDKVELQQFNTVSVNLGDGLHVHDIRINPLMAFSGQSDPKQVTRVCATDEIKIKLPDLCTNYEVSFARVTKYSTSPFIDENNNPIKDYKDRDIYSIEEIADISNSNLIETGKNQLNSIVNFKIEKLYKGELYDGRLLLKIQTKRQGCNYGAPQYLRIDLDNCLDGTIVNPIIKSGANY